MRYPAIQEMTVDCICTQWLKFYIKQHSKSISTIIKSNGFVAHVLHNLIKTNLTDLGDLGGI